MSEQLLLFKLDIARAPHKRTSFIAHPRDVLIEAPLDVTAHTSFQALILLLELRFEGLFKSFHLHSIFVD